MILSYHIINNILLAIQQCEQFIMIIFEGVHLHIKFFSRHQRKRYVVRWHLLVHSALVAPLPWQPAIALLHPPLNHPHMQSSATFQYWCLTIGQSSATFQYWSLTRIGFRGCLQYQRWTSQVFQYNQLLRGAAAHIKAETMATLRGSHREV